MHILSAILCNVLFFAFIQMQMMGRAGRPQFDHEGELCCDLVFRATAI